MAVIGGRQTFHCACVWCTASSPSCCSADMPVSKYCPIGTCWRVATGVVAIGGGGDCSSGVIAELLRFCFAFYLHSCWFVCCLLDFLWGCCFVMLAWVATPSVRPLFDVIVASSKRHTPPVPDAFCLSALPAVLWIHPSTFTATRQRPRTAPNDYSFRRRNRHEPLAMAVCLIDVDSRHTPVMQHGYM